MRINHNMSALNTYSKLGVANANQGKSLEKLSSGLRINRAGDDAAGLSISEKMRGQIQGLNKASQNAMDGISMIQTAEGGLNETSSILNRMRELGVQAANDTLQQADRRSIGDELVQLTAEIDRISTNTQFNGKNLLNGTLVGANDGAATTNVVGAAISTANLTKYTLESAKAQAHTFAAAADSTSLTLTGADGIAQTITVAAMAAGSSATLDFSKLGIKIDLVSSAGATATNIATALNGDNITVTGTGGATFQIGANSGQTIQVNFTKMDSSATSLNVIGLIANNQCVDTNTLASALVTRIDTAVSTVSTQRGVFGAAQNRLEHTIANLDTSAENLQAAESRIRDVDMAKEMMEFTKNNILNQAATAMLAQANQQPQGVLQLLR